MGIDRSGAASKGSQYWIQRYVNERPVELNGAITTATAGALSGELEWLSPLREDGYAEYYDSDFLDCLGIDPSDRPLESFWPAGGPHWDALARGTGGDMVLVEAKSHIPEIFSNPTQAKGESRKLIDTSLQEAADAFGAETSCDWSDTFYQYANRLAHLYLLRELDGVRAWMVFVGFVGDTEMNGPATAAEWSAAYQVVHRALGIGKTPLAEYVTHAHLPTF